MNATPQRLVVLNCIEAIVAFNWYNNKCIRQGEECCWGGELAVSSSTLTYTHMQLSPLERINKAWGTLIPLGDRCHVNLLMVRWNGPANIVFTVQNAKQRQSHPLRRFMIKDDWMFEEQKYPHGLVEGETTVFLFVKITCFKISWIFICN